MEVCFVCEASYLSLALISAVIVTKVALHSDYGDVVTCHHTSDCWCCSTYFCGDVSRWRAAPGQQVVAVIKLFAGANLPADPVRKSALISREVHFRMQLMHSIPDHPLIRKLVAPDYLLARWRAGGRGRVVRDQQQPQDG